MSDLFTRAADFVSKLLALVLMTMINAMITSATAGAFMLQFQAAYPGAHWPLPLAILVAVFVYLWLVFNHKLRAYITEQGTTTDE